MALPTEWAWVGELIEEEGRSMAITIPGPVSDTDKPWRGNDAGTPTSGTGVMVRYKARQNSGDHVQRATQKILIIPSETIDIQQGTKITDSLDFSDWIVEDIEKITSGSDIILYILYVRQ